MKFRDLKKDPPPSGTWILLRDKKGFLNTQPWQYYDELKNSSYVEYAILPEHITKDPTGWLSEFRGDDLPAKNTPGLVCTASRRSPFYAYFLEKEQRFLGVKDGDVIAFQPIELQSKKVVKK